jgi:hypothetical protein
MAFCRNERNSTETQLARLRSNAKGLRAQWQQLLGTHSESQAFLQHCSSEDRNGETLTAA